jgi:hypothetical protein
MAIAAYSSGNEPVAPEESGNAVPSLDFSRQEILEALAASPLAALPSVSALAAETANGGNQIMKMQAKFDVASAQTHSPWEAAIEHFNDVARQFRAYEEEVYWPTHYEIERRAPRPSLEYTVWGSENSSQIYEARPSDFERLCNDELHGEYVRPIRDAWLHYEKCNDAAEQELGWEQIDQRSGELMDLVIDAESAFMALPASNVREFAAKVEYALAYGAGCLETWAEALRAEAATFASGVSLPEQDFRSRCGAKS